MISEVLRAGGAVEPDDVHDGADAAVPPGPHRLVKLGTVWGVDLPWVV